METGVFHRWVKDRKNSSYPTYEEWKHARKSFQDPTLPGSYPTYEEWKPLPSSPSTTASISRSYPTYEEWKHLLKNLNIINLLFVLILPMRNGNTIIALLHLSPTFLFLSYLWGMETILRKTTFVISIPFLSYLWGMETNRKRLLERYFVKVLILPMRNGNLLQLLPQPRERNCSYPTYEEWKLCQHTINNNVIYKFLSYLWGMETISEQEIILHQLSSYPTYEEWKPTGTSIKMDSYRKFLSYLWGMETNIYHTPLYKRIWVLILPMRNGNFISSVG